MALITSTASADYYIVQEKATKKCKVVETRPTETTWIQIGPAAFKTQADAEKQIKTVCEKVICRRAEAAKWNLGTRGSSPRVPSRPSSCFHFHKAWKYRHRCWQCDAGLILVVGLSASKLRSSGLIASRSSNFDAEAGTNGCARMAT